MNCATSEQKEDEEDNLESNIIDYWYYLYWYAQKLFTEIYNEYSHELISFISSYLIHLTGPLILRNKQKTSID